MIKEGDSYGIVIPKIPSRLNEFIIVNYRENVGDL